MMRDSEGWEQPAHLVQGELFGKPRDWILAVAGVSIEDMEDWRARGWISFDVRELASLAESEIYEMAFVRDVARSGLSRVQIDAFLGQLAKPYRYDPGRVAYSFKFGWVQIPRIPGISELDEYMLANIDSWLDALEQRADLAALERLGIRILKATVRLRGAETEHDDT